MSIQGSSSVGKSETMKLLKCILEKDGMRAVYIDMRYIRSPIHFYEEIASQLGIENRGQSGVASELIKGNIALLLDEYWAGFNIADPTVMFAHQKENYVVTVAGNPCGVSLDEYVMQKRPVRDI